MSTSAPLSEFLGSVVGRRYPRGFLGFSRVLSTSRLSLNWQLKQPLCSHTLHVLIINTLSNKYTSCYNIHDIHKLHVWATSTETCRSLCRSCALYYEVHLLDDILMTLRQHSSGETGENNENRIPSSLHDVFSLTATPTCLWFSNGKLKRIFHYNFIDLMNEVSVAIWTVGSPFHLLALSRYCRNANWPLLPPHLRAMAARAAPCARAKQNSN